MATTTAPPCPARDTAPRVATAQATPPACDIVDCPHRAAFRVRLVWDMRCDPGQSREEVRNYCGTDARDKEQEFNRPGDLFAILTTY